MRSRKPKKAQSSILLVICMTTFLCTGCSTRRLLSNEKCKSVADELFAWPDSEYKLRSKCLLTLVVSKWGSGRHQVIQYVEKDNGELEGRLFSFFFYSDAFGIDSVTKKTSILSLRKVLLSMLNQSNLNWTLLNRKNQLKRTFHTRITK